MVNIIAVRHRYQSNKSGIIIFKGGGVRYTSGGGGTATDRGTGIGGQAHL